MSIQTPISDQNGTGREKVSVNSLLLLEKKFKTRFLLINDVMFEERIRKCIFLIIEK